MADNGHRTYVYVGLAGEGENIAEGGLLRRAEGDDEWRDVSDGLPSEPQVRALAIHPENPAVIYAGTQRGVYRSDDRGERWEALEAARAGQDVWSLAFHPSDPNVIYAGYEPCAIYRSGDGGESWDRTNTDRVVYPKVTTYMPPLAKRVIGIAADPSEPSDMYASIEVGGLLASRDGGESWDSITDGLYTENHTVDLHGVQVSSAAPGSVFIIAQVAMFRSWDKGRRWEHVRFGEMFPGRLVLPGPGGRPGRRQDVVPGGRRGRRRRSGGNAGGGRAVQKPRPGRHVGAAGHRRHAAKPDVPDSDRPRRAVAHLLLHGLRAFLCQRRRRRDVDRVAAAGGVDAKQARVSDGVRVRWVDGLGRAYGWIGSVGGRPRGTPLWVDWFGWFRLDGRET